MLKWQQNQKKLLKPSRDVVKGGEKGLKPSFKY